MRKTSDLTHEEAERFIYHFYQKIDTVLPDDLSIDDLGFTSYVWSRPWLLYPPRLSVGDTIEEMADNYIESVKDEIADILQRRRKMRRNKLVPCAKKARGQGYEYVASVVKSFYDTTYYHVVPLDEIIKSGKWIPAPKGPSSQSTKNGVPGVVV